MHVRLLTRGDALQISEPMTTPSIVLPPELLDDNATKGPVQGAVPVPGPKADLATLDLSLPLSTLLKSGTKLAHTNAEHSAGAIALANGSLELTEYVRYLTILWVVYQTLESELDKTVATPPHAGADGAVEAIDALWSDRKGKGRMLRRSPGLAEDINYYCEYLGLVKSAAKDQKTGLPSPAPPIVQDILSSPPVDLATFKSHLETLGATHPGLLLAHAYVRYLGDLSGGQLIAAKIRRVYGIPPPPAGGTAFYEFDLDGQGGRGVTATLTKHAHSADAAGKQDESSLYERKKQVEGIKNWFRDCMDMNVQDDEGLKAQLVQEAITSFHLSTRVFAMLNPLQIRTGVHCSRCQCCSRSQQYQRKHASPTQIGRRPNPTSPSIPFPKAYCDRETPWRFGVKNYKGSGRRRQGCRPRHICSSQIVVGHCSLVCVETSRRLARCKRLRRFGLARVGRQKLVGTPAST